MAEVFPEPLYRRKEELDSMDELICELIRELYKGYPIPDNGSGSDHVNVGDPREPWRCKSLKQEHP